jgi:hypothetical protein
VQTTLRFSPYSLNFDTPGLITLTKGVSLCSHKLREFVKLPKDVKKIVVVGHKRPGRDRMEIELNTKPGEWSSFLKIDGERTEMFARTTKRAGVWIKAGYKYVSIEY